MTETYPFEPLNMFFVEFGLTRIPAMPDPVELSLEIGLKVVYTETIPDRLQVNLKIKSTSDKPMAMSVEAVGLYRITDDEARHNQDLQIRFVENRAFYVLWASTAQMVRMVTGQMGIAPLNISPPPNLQLSGLRVTQVDEK